MSVNTEQSRRRALTARGFRGVKAHDWTPEVAPEDSAPAPRDVAESTSLALWGVTQELAAEMLRARMCPACGEGPWNSPLNHASRMHGIGARTMRDLCGVTTRERFTSETCHMNFSARSAFLTTENARAIGAKRSPGRRNWTKAGLRAVISNLPNEPKAQ